MRHISSLIGNTGGLRNLNIRKCEIFVAPCARILKIHSSSSSSSLHDAIKLIVVLPIHPVILYVLFFFPVKRTEIMNISVVCLCEIDHFCFLGLNCKCYKVRDVLNQFKGEGRRFKPGNMTERTDDWEIQFKRGHSYFPLCRERNIAIKTCAGKVGKQTCRACEHRARAD